MANDFKTENEELFISFLRSYLVRQEKAGGKYFGVFAFSDKDKTLSGKSKYFDIKRTLIQPEEVLETIKEFNKNDYGVYLNINPLRNQRRTKEDVVRITNILIDIDKGATDDDLFNVIHFLENSIFDYWYVSKTGNGYHILLAVDLPVEAEDLVKRILKLIKDEACSKVDVSVGDITRVMRIPFSYHFKNKPKKVELRELKEINEKSIKSNSENILKQQKLSIDDPNEFESEQFEILELDKEIKKLFEYSPAIQKKFENDRSRAEMALVDRLVLNGIISFEKVDTIMSNSKIGRWVDSTDTYKELTYNKAIENLENSQKKKNENLKIQQGELFEYLTSERTTFQSLGSGIHKGKFYFGTAFHNSENKKFNAVITSDRGYYTTQILKSHRINDEIRTIFELNYRNELFDDILNDTLWDGESIKKWLNNEEENINIKQIYEKIIRINKEYVYHSNELVHIFVACDIIASYFTPIFETRGRTYFKGDYASGKTRQSQIYANLAFNAITAGNISAAIIDRVVESTSGTLIIDNLDNMSKEKKEAVENILQIYYKRGMKGIKSDSSTFRPRAYEAFSSMVLNSIEDFSLVTESRCLIINMVRTQDAILSKKRFEDIKKDCKHIRNNLHIITLKQWKQVQEIYTSLDIEELMHRDFEKVSAVLSIAKFIDESVFEDVKKFCIEQINFQKKVSKPNDWEYLMYLTMDSLLDNKNTDIILVKQITERATKEGFIDFYNSSSFSKSIGRKLAKLPELFQKTYRNGAPGYILYRTNLDEAMKLRGYYNIIKESEEDSTLSFNNSSNIKNKEKSQEDKISNSSNKNNKTNDTNNTENLIEVNQE